MTEAEMTPNVNQIRQKVGASCVIRLNKLFSRCVVYFIWNSLMDHWSFMGALVASCIEKVGKSVFTGLRFCSYNNILNIHFASSE